MLRILSLVLAVGLSLAVQPAKYEDVQDVESPPLPDRNEAFESDPLIDIFPPKNYPGEILEKTEFSKIDKALDEVLKSGDLFHDRRCAIGVANEGTAKLSKPQMATTSGKVHSAIPQEVNTGQTSLNLFYKTKGTARGTVGVMSYDIEGTNHKAVIFWMVPFDFNLFDVKLNIKVYTRNIPTNKDLANHLKKNAGALPANTWHARTEYGIKMRATITDNAKSKLIVWVNADGYDPNGGYDLFTDCRYHPGRVRKICTQECYGGSWCWTDKKCKKASECVGRHACKGKC